MLRRILLGTVIALTTLLAAQIARPQPAPPAAPPAPDNNTAEPPPSRWPLRVPSSNGDITVFQPQLEDFQGDQISARSAVEIPTSNPDQPVYGAVWLQSRVSVDRVARTVQVLEVNVTKTRFPNIDDAAAKSMGEMIRQAIASQPVTLSLDQLLESLQTIQQEKQEDADLKTDAPAIIFRDHPAILVLYDGPPKMIETPTQGILRAANTPFFVVLDSQNKTYFLKGAGLWFSAPAATGPFQSAGQVPPAVSQLADASDYKDPQSPVSAQEAAAIEIVTATDPTELIWTDGAPQMSPIEGTNLLYVSNTDADWFIEIDSQKNFLLLSGRWYSSPNRNGPWTYVASDQLPADFAKIPANSDKGDVLAFVAGTQASSDAVANNEIPETAAVDRGKYDQPDVQYDGDPQFEPVENDNCSYATNTDAAVLQVGPDYYCCNNAVWYHGRAARGPWEICTRVPQECYRLPPSCPLYACRFVHIYGYTPDVCYVGYTPGYVGSYVFHHAVVYGTGWHYKPWYGRIYVARPHTFGFAVHYNAYVGHWGFTFGLATGGGGGTWIGNGDHSWGRSGHWFGFGGYRPAVSHGDVRTDLFRTQFAARARTVTTIRPARADVYGRSVYDRRKDVRWDQPHIAAAPVHEEARAAVHATAARQEELRNDVFADRDGNIYRHTDTGWETREGNAWHAQPAPHVEEHPAEIHAAPPRIEEHPAEEHPVERPEEHPIARPAPVEEHRDAGAELNREFQARQAAEQRLPHYERPAPAPAAVHIERSAPAPQPRQDGRNGR